MEQKEHTMEIRKANTTDVDNIVTIHKQAFPDFFLTTLGDRFLHLYYCCMCRCEGALTLCVIDNGTTVGFSSTALRSAGFNAKLIKQNIVSFALEAIKLLLFKPQALFRLMNNFTKKNCDMEDYGEYAELFSIGVSPLCQGKGVGSLLLSENERMICGEGRVKRLSLTTDKNNNESAIAFYQRNGYKVLYEFTAYPNRDMYRFIKDLE